MLSSRWQSAHTCTLNSFMLNWQHPVAPSRKTSNCGHLHSTSQDLQDDAGLPHASAPSSLHSGKSWPAFGSQRTCSWKTLNGNLASKFSSGSKQADRQGFSKPNRLQGITAVALLLNYIQLVGHAGSHALKQLPVCLMVTRSLCRGPTVQKIRSKGVEQIVQIRMLSCRLASRPRHQQAQPIAAASVASHQKYPRWQCRHTTQKWQEGLVEI